MEKVKPSIDIDKSATVRIKVRGDTKEMYIGDVRVDTHIDLVTGVEKQKIKLTLIEV